MSGIRVFLLLALALPAIAVGGNTPPKPDPITSTTTPNPTTSTTTPNPTSTSTTSTTDRPTLSTTTSSPETQCNRKVMNAWDPIHNCTKEILNSVFAVASSKQGCKETSDLNKLIEEFVTADGCEEKLKKKDIKKVKESLSIFKELVNATISHKDVLKNKIGGCINKTQVEIKKCAVDVIRPKEKDFYDNLGTKYFILNQLGSDLQVISSVDSAKGMKKCVADKLNAEKQECEGIDKYTDAIFDILISKKLPDPVTTTAKPKSSADRVVTSSTMVALSLFFLL